MDNLVDLSLFASSPTGDRFSQYEEPSYSPTYGFPSFPSPPQIQQKLLPPIPHRRPEAISPEPRSNQSRCILQRVRRMRIEPSLYSTASSRQQTLQQRRNPAASTPELTIPTSSASATACPTARPAAPMIWLADEEMWLVADTAHAQEELFGFYASAPHSDPGPNGWYAPDSYEDLPPAYSSSPASSPSPGDFSPVRSQFMSLFENRGQETIISPERKPEPVKHGYDRRMNSPMFQEAISGLGFGNFDEVAPGWNWRGVSRELERSSSVKTPERDSMLRRESWHSESMVSPMTSTTDSPNNWTIKMTAKERQHSRGY